MKYFKSIILTLSIAALVAACDDNLIVSNPNLQTSIDYWKTESDIAEGVTAIYDRFIMDGGFMRTIPALQDVRGDDVNSASPWTLYPLTGNFTILNTDGALEWPWRDFYQAIAKANLVFYYTPNVSFSDENYKNRLLGQAYFLRAFAYYELVQNYQKVPLVLSKPLSPDDYYPTTATDDEVWAAIESDLTNAMNMLPKSYDAVSGADAGQKGRATWGAAAGLLGKVYMIRNQYSKAATVLKSIIESKQYELVSSYGDNFSMSNENNAESLFEIQFGVYGTYENWVGEPNSNWRQASCLDYPYGMSAYGAWEDFHPTKWLYNEYKKERCKDGTLDPRLYWTIVSYEKEYDHYTDGRSNTIFGEEPYSFNKLDSTNTKVYIAKYTYARIPGYTLEGDGLRANSGINYRFMRYSEILLLYAEALNELGSTSNAYGYIQQVRDRAGLPDLSTTRPNMTQAQMREQIAHERALEFGIESVRLFDVMRWGWLYDSAKLEELKAHDPEYKTWVKGHEYLPIPQLELDINKNLTKNSAE